MEKLNVLLVHDMVLFPNSEIRIECDSVNDREIISVAESSSNQLILIVNPIINEVDNITSLPSVGVVGKIKLKMDVPNGKTRIVLSGIKRVIVKEYINNDNFYEAELADIPLNYDIEEASTYRSILVKAIEKYINNVPYMSNAVLSQIPAITDLGNLCDLVSTFLPFSYEKKKRYILEINPIIRSKLIMEDINEDLKVIALEKSIEDQVEKELNDSQKEFYLREKIKVIQKELGDVNTKEDEVANLKYKLSKLKCNNKVKERIKKEISRYETVNSNSPELGTIRDYLDWMLNLPWHKFTKDIEDLSQVKRSLDASHYGLDDVKSRILEYLAVKQNTNNVRSPIICLVGPPGVGKTSLALSIAKSINRKVTKISVGGINDEAEIIGHRRTYVGANPGRIIQGIRKAGTTNPVFIIDEIDKMTKDIKGDPASSLLEVLDPEQNSKFSDHYIEEEFDLSKVMFIATANYIEQIPYELRDRLELIELSSYTEYEKLDIAKNYLIPRQLEEHGLTELQVSFEDEAILTIIRNYTKEAGVRELERLIASLLRKIVKKLLTEFDVAQYNITNDLLEEFLGKKKYQYLEKQTKKQVGVVNGMAYTVFGGDILPIEVTYYKGNGKLILTGSLGEVMQESAHIALSYIKANAKEFGIDFKLFEENDLHIHLPEGAVNKEGPSAGIALATSLISVLSNKAVSGDISMTGELTLQGRVLPIGGLKEKVLGASRAGIKKIFLPKQNEPDLDEIPEEIKSNLKFVLVSNYIDVYKEVFGVK